MLTHDTASVPTDPTGLPYIGGKTEPQGPQLVLRELLDEADRAPRHPAPPNANRGVLTPTVGIHWLEMSHADTTGRVWCDLFGAPLEEWAELPHGIRHYPRARVWGAVVVGYGGDDRLGSHVVLSGMACDELIAAGRIKNWAKLLDRAVNEFGCKVTTTDYFMDVRDGSITVEECMRKWKRREAVSKTRKAYRWEKLELGCGEDNGGETLRIGEMVSNTFVRIYDKAKEQCPKELKKAMEREKWLEETGPWVRIEVRLREEMAMGAVKLLIERGFGWGLVASLINRHVEFKESEASGPHGNRVPTWAPWAKVMAAKERVVLTTGRPEPTLHKSLQNLARMFGPTLWALMAFNDGDLEWVRQLVLKEAHRVRPKQWRMVQEAERVRDTWAVA